MTVIYRMHKNSGLKLLSLSLALVLWLFVNYDRETEREMLVPVSVANIPSGLKVAGEVPSHINVRIAGRRIQLLWIAPDRFSVTLDLTRAVEGPVLFPELAKAVHVTRGLRVTRVSPAAVQLNLVKK